MSQEWENEWSHVLFTDEPFFFQIHGGKRDGALIFPRNYWIALFQVRVDIYELSYEPVETRPVINVKFLITLK